MNESTPEKSLDEYGSEYYSTRFGAVPYERSFHWQHFFSIVAAETIRGLQPRRVLDAGCAMGFLVEQFWDRGIYCEGVDISEFAISQVRRDIKPYCWVGSLTDPLPGKYDLITCIEVLEHLPPELVKPAVANLCQATDALLFSSTPNDLEEPTHYSVRPPIFWLQLFAEFGFWPDARFDAGYITSHAMLLRKSPPPPDNYLLLYSEYVRQKLFFEAKTAEAGGLETQLKALRAQHEQMTLHRQRAEQSLSDSLTELDRVAGEREQARAERDRVAAERDSAVHSRNLLAERAHALTLEKDRILSEYEQTQRTLQAVLGSRAWRLAEACRAPVRKLRRDWPRVHKVVSFMARAVTGRRKTRAASVAATSQSSDPASPADGPAAPSIAEPFVPQFTRSVEFSYQQWIDEREPGPAELMAQRQNAAALEGPLFSIVVPVHQTDHAMLQACIHSVVAQTYPRWELCAAITPDSDPRNRAFLRAMAKLDPRLRLLDLTSNEGISRNTNAALGLATGEFIALLDHDDALAPFALYEVAARLKTRPDADILYSDHDYLDPENGLRRDPLLKPEWSPSILFSANYLTHLTVLRRSLLDRVGPFDPATDGAQDWDLFLRASEQTTRIVHIPKILYHWRMHAASTAHNDASKNYAAEAQLLALRRHMERTGMDAEPEVRPDGLLHVRFKQPPAAKVSIIIPTKDRLDLLSRCISTLMSLTAYEQFEILIVDNGSTETATKEYFGTLTNPRIRVLWHPGPFNYSAVNNRAAREATGDVLLFLNNDVEITRPEWLTELVSWALLPPVGIVGAKLLRADGTIQHAGVVLGMSGFADHPFADSPPLIYGMAGSTGWYRDFLAVTGACLAMRRQVFEEIGGFDENFVLCGSDVEICLRAHERGYRVVLNPFAELIHHERQTRGADIPPADFVASFQHYRRWLAAGDPYWNPNLSLAARQPAFRYRSEPPSLVLAEKHVASLKDASPPPRPVGDEEVWVGWFDCSAEQFHRLRQHNSKVNGFKAVRRVMWFISPFDVPFYGGIYTILRFCDYWQKQKNVEILFAVCGSANQRKTAALIRQVYPAVEDDRVFVLDGVSQAANLPPADAGICTLWTTPYFALHHQNLARRFYLIQDFEPAFYPAGSASALVESTYRMGMYGIANTISLERMYETEYGGKAMHFKPSVDMSVFHPAEHPPRQNPRRPLQVFCYGRPKHPRNAFELVKQAMIHLKTRLGDRVRIVSAGDEWRPADYGLQGIVENLGILAYEDTGRLYRESQVGVVMMLTRHPSYIPLELMASGCLTVTNVNAWTSWLLKDGENCLLSPATATAISETVEQALLDTKLRETIRGNALAMVRADYLDWAKQAENVFAYLCDPEAALGHELTKSAAAPASKG